ncbi:ferric reductase-like transmembrane domain-containing protein [Dactylosporangium sp. NPDC048998]|uniref:ferredoxin reductase family protein n=1 Tax=Dactylosporangium sp. NPDC048998 TaxID=3363976 RepID=UPI00370FA574
MTQTDTLTATAARHANGHAPGISRTGNRLFFYTLFYFALAASVELWWLNTPAGSVDTPAAALIAAGRVTGMVGGFVLIVQTLMMSRAAWLEAWVGAHELLIWHRALGGTVVVVVLAHAALIVVGYAGAEHASLAHETWTMLTTYRDMVSAFVATGVLVALGLLAIRTIRRRMRYEVWYYLHLSAYLALLLGYGHQFTDGADLQSGFARWYWISLYAFALACLVWGRVVEPLWLNLRHRLHVIEVVPEGAGMMSIYIGGRRLDRLDAEAGQYFRWRFLMRGGWWQAHPFSLSAAPNADWLRITVKVVGDHTSDLQHVRPGVRVFAEGPSGAFTAGHRLRHGALLIAGGSGIAPIRALLDDLPADTVLLFRARSEAELTFRAELDELAVARGIQVWYVLGSRDDPAPRRAFSPRGLRELVPDVRRRDVYMCGPDGLISTSRRALRRLRVPGRQIHLDPFEF